MTISAKGKIVAITGAAGGIGQALCDYFAGAGASIVALDRDERVQDLARDLAQYEVEVRTIVADTTNADAVTAAFSTIGRLDVLINNAGYSKLSTLGKTDPAGWREHIDGNLNGAFNCTHAVLPGMVERKSGNIVNIGSVNGLMALSGPAYSAAKAGLIAFTKALALEYGRHGIRANAVLPASVRTPVWAEREARDPDFIKSLERWYPLGRIVEPIEVANVVGFLASDGASAVSGTAIPVDCGLVAGNLGMARDITLGAI